MSRIKRGVTHQAKRKTLIGLAKGYRTIRHTQFRAARQALMKAMQYAYRDRRNKKRTFRGLWIIRINAGVKALGGTYSTFVKNLKTKNIILDRKILAQIAQEKPESLAAVFETAKN